MKGVICNFINVTQMQGVRSSVSAQSLHVIKRSIKNSESTHLICPTRADQIVSLDSSWAINSIRYLNDSTRYWLTRCDTVTQ